MNHIEARNNTIAEDFFYFILIGGMIAFTILGTLSLLKLELVPFTIGSLGIILLLLIWRLMVYYIEKEDKNYERGCNISTINKSL